MTSQARTALTLGALLAALAAWLLAPWHAPRADGERAPLALALCDLSPSVTRTRPGWRAELAAQLEREAQRAAELGAQLVVLAYAHDRALLRLPARGADARAWSAGLSELEPRELARGMERSASDLWSACAALQEPTRGRELARLLLWSDGQWTGRDPVPALADLLARAAEVELRAPGPPELDDLALVELALPEQGEVGAPLVARARLRLVRGSGAAPAAGARLEIDLQTSAGSLAWTLDAALPESSDGTWSVDLPLGPALAGVARLELRARLLPSGDAVPENDRRTASCAVGPELRVGVLASEEGLAAAREFAAACSRLGGLSARAFALDELAESLARDDVLVLHDAPLELLPAEALADFARRGRGWLACAGPGLGRAAQRRSATAGLLPLDFDAVGPGPRDVLLLVDGSGSMVAPRRDARPTALAEAQDAAERLALAAAADERVVLRLFGAELGPELELAGGLPPLAGLAPGGRTDIPGALGRLATASSAGGREVLALLITDGRDQALDQALDEGRLAGLRERLALARVELSIFAVGAEPDLEFLGALAGERGELRVVAPGEELVAVLERSLSAERLREAGPYPVAVAQPLGELSRAALGPLAGGEPQALRRYWRSEPRPAAELLWVAAGGEGVGEPLLALKRLGVGAVAALAALPGPEHAADLAGLLRWLAERRPRERPRLELHAARLSLDDVPADWPLELFALSPGADPASAALLLPPAETLLDPRDRRSGAWPGAAPAGGQIELRPGPAQPALAVLLLEAEPAPEFPWPEQGQLGALFAAARSGSAPQPPPRRGPHPLGLPVLVLALAALTLGGLSLGRHPAVDQALTDTGR